ncbi:MAG: thermonuclease family protein [Candidatus Paceibacterota bacterium]|jgi:micrococcal nuclease
MLKKILLGIGGLIVVFFLIGILAPKPEPKTTDEIKQEVSDNLIKEVPANKVDDLAHPELSSYSAGSPPAKIDETIAKNLTYLPKSFYSVVKVVDGDTIDVSINGKTERLRLIGINTPETVDPRKPVECFGVEASNKAKSLLSNKKVGLESDPSQGERDKYDRLLRYVYLEDGTNFNLLMIKEGYAYEYTYDLPYRYQTNFKEAQKYAQDNKLGLWGDTCDGKNTPVTTTTTIQPSTGSNGCTIKGNISSGGKIYHVIGCGSYNATKIDESVGEKWFCTEKEALDAGWRKALNCS